MIKKTSFIGFSLAFAGSVSFAQPPAIEEITVIGRQEFLETQFNARRSASNVDAAKLMNEVPGGAASNNGPLTGQIQYRGLYGPRVNVRVDGMLIHGGGPNWMAPPLHHIPAGLMDELVVEQGIPSIATGGGIGGAATAYWKKPDYSLTSGWEFTGDTEASFSSVDDGSSFSGVFGLASANHKIFVVGNFDEGDDYDTDNGHVSATEYDRDVYGIGYGYQNGVHEFELDWHTIETDDTGTPSLPMDIDWFDTDIWNARYATELAGGTGLEIRIYGSEIDHGMSNYLLRPAPDFSSLPLPPFVGTDRRRVATDSDELGYKITLDAPLGEGTFILGLEGKTAEHNAAVFDPDFAPFFVENFNDTDVDSQSLFSQWSATLDSGWYVELGARVEKVDMDTGNVDAFPARLVDMNPAMWPMGTPPRAVWMLRQGFNSSDRNQDDTNVDVVLKGRYQATDNLVVEVGVAQKERSPIYQERFLWIPLEANAGIGDGNNYVGNPDLDPESSLQYELGFDWDFGSYYFSPRFYYREVDDYIQGVPATNMAVIGVSANANGDPTPLMFANTDANFWGVDLTYGIEFDSNWRIEGMASWMKGERDDINDNIYRVAPASLRANLIYDAGNITFRLEQVIVGEQDDLSATNTLDPLNINNSFVKSDSYDLTNVFVSWFVNPNVTLTTGIENLFDEDYIDHLSGFNRVIGSAVPRGSRLFGQGRNIFGRIQFIW